MPNTSFSRRDFLKVAGLTLAATSLTCCGLGYAATRPPELETTAFTFGKETTMSKRILVTYATRAGSTVEIAKAIAAALSARGFTAEVKPVKDKPALAGYQAVIMGSAIRMGSWLPEAMEFVKTNQSALSGVPVALFSAHILNAGDDETSRANRLAYLNAVRPLLPQATEAYFVGKMDYATLSFFDRLIAKLVEKQTGSPSGDLRDWDKIRNWADGTFAGLS